MEFVGGNLLVEYFGWKFVDRNFWCKFYGGKYLVEMPISEVSENLDFGTSSR